MKLSLSPRAAQDIEEIADYIAVESPRAAARLIQQFRHRFETLSSMPFMGVERSELMPGLRSFPVATYVVFYHVNKELRIERILHGARDIDALFD